MFTHTLRTEKGTRATIEIPYSKLGIQEKTLE